MRLAPGSRLLFVGDILPAGTRPAPLGPTDGLGLGLAAIVDGMLKAIVPHHHIEVSCWGLPAGALEEFGRRWDTEFLARPPDWVALCLNREEAERHFEERSDENASRFEHQLDEVLARMRPRVQGMIVLAPFVLTADPADPRRQRAAACAQALARLAFRHRAILVNPQGAFDVAFSGTPAAAFSRDGTAVNMAGLVLLARGFLAGIDVIWAPH